MSFTPEDEVGEVIVRSPISITLASRISVGEDTTYKSEFKAFSNGLRSTLLQLKRTSVEVSCVASSSVKDTVSFIVQGKIIMFWYCVLHALIFTQRSKNPQLLMLLLKRMS